MTANFGTIAYADDTVTAKRGRAVARPRHQEQSVGGAIDRGCVKSASLHAPIAEIEATHLSAAGT